MSAVNVHLVVPCFRESARIGAFLPALCAAMDELGGVAVEVVEDGSGEEEAARMRAVVEGLRTAHPCLLPLSVLPENLGKGGAIYAGWAAAAPEAVWLAFVDADGAVPAGEVARVIRRAREHAVRPQAHFASRVKMLGRRVERLLARHLVGRIYATLVSELLGIPVYDSQCGLKVVPAAAWRKVAPRLAVRGFAFDVELLVALLDSGCVVVEEPVDWQEIPGGKVRVLRDSWRMARDVLAIRARRAELTQGLGEAERM